MNEHNDEQVWVDGGAWPTIVAAIIPFLLSDDARWSIDRNIRLTGGFA